ncbi:hypothetical protein EQVG_00031 [Emiliania huxleyi virus 207]|nr:hypothetical protein EQVG_00031 [Emiliania huxleyi virus 207]AEP16076.1 hypothetical protein ERVG_00200 [Emiliania huxleyi virus 208]
MITFLILLLHYAYVYCDVTPSSPPPSPPLFPQCSAPLSFPPEITDVEFSTTFGGRYGITVAAWVNIGSVDSEVNSIITLTDNVLNSIVEFELHCPS